MSSIETDAQQYPVFCHGGQTFYRAIDVESERLLTKNGFAGRGCRTDQIDVSIRGTRNDDGIDLRVCQGIAY